MTAGMPIVLATGALIWLATFASVLGIAVVIASLMTMCRPQGRARSLPEARRVTMSPADVHRLEHACNVAGHDTPRDPCADCERRREALRADAAAAVRLTYRKPTLPVGWAAFTSAARLPTDLRDGDEVIEAWDGSVHVRRGGYR